MLSDDEFRERARRVRLLILDADGVLTDGSITYDAGLVETKRFFVRDGFALRCWARAGHRSAVISGRGSPAVAYRCRELGVAELIQNSPQKVPAFRRLLEREKVAAEEVCYLGDDLPDLPLVLASGIGAAVADAVDELRAHADWVTMNPGGHGAVRELIERLLIAQDRWAEVVAHYTRPG